MPPPMPNLSKRMTAQPSRPVARYRPGKPVHEEESSEDEESEHGQPQQKRPPPKKVPSRLQASNPPARAAAEQDSDEDGFVTDPDDAADDVGVSVPAIEAASSGRPAATLQRPAAPVGGSQSDGEEDEDDSSSEEVSGSDESSESDAPARKFQRPTFIKKADRTGSASLSATAAPAAATAPTAATSEDPDIADTKARRLAETDYLISEKLNRDSMARAQSRRAWDDDDALDPDQVVDDTDGLDPEAEHAAWRLRELQRLKRDREALIAREKEIEEIERRRNLTAEEREAEDRAHLDKQKEEKAGRGQSGFLAKYHHKGAFFQDSEAAEFLKKRDIMGARFEDEVTDKSALPEYMRIRDMSKLGKKGRTRYTDLRAEDTGGFGNDVSRWKGAMGAGARRDGDSMDSRGVDERFLPDDDRGRGGPQSSGANSAPLGPRREKRERSRSRSPRRSDVGEDDRDSYRPRRRSYSRSQSRSRRRTPSRDRYAQDKRRRVET